MSTARVRSCLNWAALVGAGTFYLFLWLCFVLGTVLGDCVESTRAALDACGNGKDAGLRMLLWIGLPLFVLGFVAEWFRPWWGVILLALGPFLLFGLILLLPH